MQKLMHTHTHTHTQQGETGSPLTRHDWSLFPSLSLPAEIVLTKEREKEGEGWYGWGKGCVCVCCSVVTRGERERERERERGGWRELEGKRGSVGEKDRVPEESLSHTHIHTHTVTHTHLRRLHCCTFSSGIVDYSPNWSTRRADSRHDQVSGAFMHLLKKKKFFQE